MESDAVTNGEDSLTLLWLSQWLEFIVFSLK